MVTVYLVLLTEEEDVGFILTAYCAATGRLSHNGASYAG